MGAIAVLDFGGQYSHLISRRIRDIGVYSEVLPCDTEASSLLKINGLKGIILSGGAASAYSEKSPKCSKDLLSIGVPVLGICYGHHLIAQLEGGKVSAAGSGEYGLTETQIRSKSSLLKGLGPKIKAWMNHRDIVESLPEAYSITASTKNSPIAGFENTEKSIYGVQFHPEVSHTEQGDKILENFAVSVCRAKKQWKTQGIINDIISEAKKELKGKKAVIALSGGIDSSTAAALLSKAIGKKLTAIYVDTGLMRHKETEFIIKAFSKFPLKLKIIKASGLFFKNLKGVVDPEKKRKIIGNLFIKIFEKEARLEKATVLVQGTIYSDRIESGITKNSSVIKSHHNVGGLPENMNLRLYEPLRNLYKDEVRKVAKETGLPEEISGRHVFPGPGIAVRILGEVTPEKAEIVRKASHIIEQELKLKKLYSKVWMAFAVLLPVKSVGIQGDARSYKYPIVVRIIESKDAMTANFAKIPYDVLEKISARITNEISQVNRVAYDISNKPPATMEWE